MPNRLARHITNWQVDKRSAIEQDTKATGIQTARKPKEAK